MSDAGKRKVKVSKPDFFNRKNIAFLSVAVICIFFALFINLHVKINELNTRFEKKYENILKNNENIIAEIEDLSKAMEKYNNIKIDKSQFTEIYMQLQELTGMISNEVKREYYITKMVSEISKTNDELESKAIYDISKAIYEESVKYNFNPLLVTALVNVESNFRPEAVSNAHAYGLCQVRRFIAPELATSIGIEWDGAEKTLFDPIKNIKIGVYYLSMLNRNFDDLKTALIAYNQGPYYVQGELSNNRELNQIYLNKVLNNYADLRGFSMEEVDFEMEPEG
ncbi:MAG: transglycosylase SLT domain-containing protein [Candidatus Caldatribacteriota bacterium]|nr:transglycosylase SLT domain-containing protein [Candidatus Caldatribacteriota bacterium]